MAGRGCDWRRARYFEMRNCDSLVPIWLNTAPIPFEAVTTKVLFGSGYLRAMPGLGAVPAQFFNRVETGSPPVFTCTVNSVMLAALILSQVIFWRASIDDWSVYQRSCVFRPSVSRMMTWL